MYILFMLVCAHFLCDFALQNDFVAKFKAVYVEYGYNPMWFWVLLAHSAIHALAVLLITQMIVLALIMLITHFLIDLLKCQKYLSFNQDQLLHLGIVVLLTLSYHSSQF